MKAIPYEHIDPEIRELVRALNGTNCVVTISSCIGHGTNPVAGVIFEVTDEAAWRDLMLRVLALSQRLAYANLDVYQWHRLDATGDYVVDWLLQVQVHPRNRESSIPEEDRVRTHKSLAIESLVAEMHKWQSGYPATCEGDHRRELPMHQ